MTLRLYDTQARQKRDFVPIDPERVTMYVCGPTVYNYAHIGNARPVVVFDVLFRLLRSLYGADHVIYAANVTDVDDKINQQGRFAEGVGDRRGHKPLPRRLPRRHGGRWAPCRRRSSPARPGPWMP